MLAVYKGHLGMVQLLLNKGASPDLRKKVQSYIKRPHTPACAYFDMYAVIFYSALYKPKLTF